MALQRRKALAEVYVTSNAYPGQPPTRPSRSVFIACYINCTSNVHRECSPMFCNGGTKGFSV